ncbi:MAG: DUF1887 family protein [Acidobacteria bacterium]|nr:DUF1887 family protein [Acidobacteriota bacterium]
MLTLAGNSLHDLLKKGLGDAPSGLWRILALSAALMILLWLVARRVGALSLTLKPEAPAPERVAAKPKPPPSKGLIALVSNHEPVEKAIEYHSEMLERVWLIATTASESVAYEIREKYDGLGIKFDIVHLDDEFDVQKAQAVVEGIYASRLDGMAEEDVTADFTGGTKMMTVGMIFGCLSPARRLQYVPANREGGGLVPLEPIEYNVKAPGAEAARA